MGSPETEPGHFADESQHEVELTRGFWMAETEVTQGQWQKLIENNPSRSQECGAGCPVERVSWWDAVTFANRLSEAAALEVCYALAGCTGQPGTPGYSCESAELQRGPGCGGYRLPSEAEWEYAVRAGAETAIYAPELDAIAWWGGNSGEGPHPVAGKAANAWGLQDMLGNVWEWTGDWSAVYPTGAVTDPTGPAEGSERVFRGGAWDFVARGVRSASRNAYVPGVRNDVPRLPPCPRSGWAVGGAPVGGGASRARSAPRRGAPLPRGGAVRDEPAKPRAGRRRFATTPRTAEGEHRVSLLRVLS
ncbi:MAG: formylglycine-generating enzyme family protein [Thermoanaerobaculia bacterium]